MARFERVIWMVLDSVGIGELPDAAEYGDAGRSTLGHIAESRPLKLPHLVRLGLANIAPLKHLSIARIWITVKALPQFEHSNLRRGSAVVRGGCWEIGSLVRRDVPSVSFAPFADFISPLNPRHPGGRVRNPRVKSTRGAPGGNTRTEREEHPAPFFYPLTLTRDLPLGLCGVDLRTLLPHLDQCR